MKIKDYDGAVMQEGDWIGSLNEGKGKHVINNLGKVVEREEDLTNKITYLMHNEINVHIKEAADEIVEMLLLKNQAYGDSALNPLRIFSKADAEDGIKVRIDDKLSRIKNQGFDDSEDAIQDLIGYLILYKAGKRAGII